MPPQEVHMYNYRNTIEIFIIEDELTESEYPIKKLNWFARENNYYSGYSRLRKSCNRQQNFTQLNPLRLLANCSFGY